MRKRNGYWTYEKCKEVSLKYKSISEFEEDFSGAVCAIRKNGWLDIFDRIRIHKPPMYWTYDKCKEMSLKYDNISKFRKENGGCYYRIHENNWVELFNHMRYLPNFYKRLIYVYEFNNNSCYVGLTCDLERRNNQHLSDLNSSVYQEYNKGINYKLVIKSNMIDVKDAVILEKQVLDEYKSAGWIVLNKNRTGSIGGINLYWTKDRCISELIKYQSYGEFRKKSSGAHNSSFKNGWLYEILIEYMPNYKKRK